MALPTRTLSPQESRIVLALRETDRMEVTRREIASLLGGTLKAADHVIESLRRKGWLERAAWGKYLLIPPEHGPDVLGNSNLLALASHIIDPYYFGFGTAAAHYGLTTQVRNVVYVVALEERRGRMVHDSRVHIVKQARKKFFGFTEVDVLGYKVMMSDREKTSIDCIDHHELAGGIGEAATILATATRRYDWNKASDYLAHIDAGALARRFGWLCDYVKAEMPPDVRARIQTIALKSRNTWLGAPPEDRVSDAIGYDEIWRVFVNVSRAELHGSAGLGQRKTVKRTA
jgi:predicted transcriptional regulator of viral defense system